MTGCKQFFQRHQLLIGQITCFYLGKTFIGIVELPNDTKNISYTPILMTSAILYLAAFAIKLFSEGRPLLLALALIYLKLFLVWIVALLSIIFSFSLSHQLGWPMLQIITQTICQILATSTLVIQCSSQFIQKAQFIAYEILLAFNILVLGIKTVIFVEYDLESPHKDMVLLNLTTRIALAILIMDSIERAYSKAVQDARPRDALVEQEMSSRNDNH